MKIISLLLSTFISVFMHLEKCMAEEIRCPSFIEKTNQSTPASQPGWDSWSEQLKHDLNGGTIFVGHPSLAKPTIYDEVKRRKNGRFEEEVYIFHLAPIDDPFIACEYAFTSIRFIRRLKGLEKCEFIGARLNKDSPYRISAVKCF